MSEILIGSGDPPLSTLIERRITNPYSNVLPPSAPPAFSFTDRNARPGIPASTANPEGHTGYDQILADAAGVSTPVGTFMRGYSGFTFPKTFQETTVRWADDLGIGAVLNTKIPTVDGWRGLANGSWDEHIATFFNSWPQHVFGSFTINHEPENDGGDAYKPHRPQNPKWVEWANVWGPIWCRGIERVIRVAAPIIRARGLNVGIGGNLMEYSWNSYVAPRWMLWNWWDYVHPDFYDVAEFQINIYANFVNTMPPVGADLIPRLLTTLAAPRSAGLHRWSILESAISRSEHNGGGTLLGTYEGQAEWLEDFIPRVSAIPGGRTYTYFSTPGAPVASDLQGRALEVYANACLNGTRPI